MMLSQSIRCRALGALFVLSCCANLPSLAAPKPLKGPTTAARPADAATCVPAWPEQEIGLGESGTAIVMLRISPKGTVTDAKITSSSGLGDLDEATLAAARECRFEPALKGGVPVASSVPFAHEWKLPAPPVPSSAERPARVANYPECAMPVYPKASLRNMEQGTVVLSFLIGVDGMVLDSKVLASSGFRDLDKAAQAAIGRCRFKSSTSDGKPVQEWVQVSYKWAIE